MCTLYNPFLFKKKKYLINIDDEKSAVLKMWKDTTNVVAKQRY